MKVSLHDKPESFKTVGVVSTQGRANGGNQLLIPSSFFQRKYSKATSRTASTHQEKLGTLSMHSVDRKVNDRSLRYETFEKKQEDMEVRVIQNQVLIENYFDKQKDPVLRENTYFNLVKYFSELS